MDITFPPPPAPAVIVRGLVIVLLLGVVTILVATWLKRTARRPFTALVSYALFAGGTGLLVLMGLVFIAPSEHAGIRWTPSENMNSAIDVAIGLVFWAVCGVVYRYAWRAQARPA